VPNIFVFTASRDEALEHYKKTIENPIPESLLIKFLGKNFLRELRRVYPEGPIYAWGATPKSNNIRIWNAMSIGDYVLSYRRGILTKLFRIIGKVHNREFAEYLWGRGKYPDNLGLTWEYMYFLQHISDINKPSPITFRGHTGPLKERARAKVEAVIREALGRSLDEIDRYKRMEILSVKLKRMLRVKKIRKPDKVRALTLSILRRIERGNYYVPDNWSKRKVRVGQSILRELLLEMYESRCCICGLDIEDLLEVAHIRRWSDDPYNRLNPSNCILLCVLHHKALDKGLIKIENNKVYCAEKVMMSASDSVKEYLLRFHGKRIAQPAISAQQAIANLKKYLELS